MGQRVVQVLAGVLLGLATVAAFFLLGGPPRGPSGPASFQQVDPEPYPAADFALTTHEGRRASLGDFSGERVLLFFGFTHCPDVCPATLSNVSRVLEQLEEGERVRGLLVTVDPERDTPERLREYMDRFHPSLVGLTGSLEEIREVAEAYGVYFRKASEGGEISEHAHDHGEAPAEPGDGYLVDHTARVFVIDEGGRVVTSLAPIASPDEIVGALERAAPRR